MDKKQAILPLNTPQKKLLVTLAITLYMLRDNVIYRIGKILRISGRIPVEMIRRKLANCKMGVLTVRLSPNYF